MITETAQPPLGHNNCVCSIRVFCEQLCMTTKLIFLLVHISVAPIIGIGPILATSRLIGFD